ncbi:MAG: hypothetical protein K0R61_151 [Microvirga sp.]|jgi:hypothetical protein|nr:hypothetical protein [Microvirga sp.]
MDQTAQAGMGAGAGLVARPGIGLTVGVGTRHVFECFGADGKLKWREEVDNLVTTEGLNALITNTFKTIPGSVTWYVGLKGAGAVAAGNTMASHAAWSEIHTEYSEGTRPALTLGTVASGSVDNSASKATFTITGSATVAGAFITSNSTKNGTTGTLYGATDFGASRAVISGDSLQVTATISITAT